jgi:hypothetical protein
MRIVDIRGKTCSIASPITNAYIDAGPAGQWLRGARGAGSGVENARLTCAGRGVRFGKARRSIE